MGDQQGARVRIDADDTKQTQYYEGEKDNERLLRVETALKVQFSKASARSGWCRRRLPLQEQSALEGEKGAERVRNTTLTTGGHNVL